MAHSPLRPNSPRINMTPDLECGICVDIFLEPSVLDCGHRFCSLCILTWHQTCLAFNCPLCRAESLAPPAHSPDWTRISDAFVEARILELRRKGFWDIAKEQERDREERRASWKALSIALAAPTPQPASPTRVSTTTRAATQSEDRLARLEALAQHLQVAPDIWRGEPVDENLARRAPTRSAEETVRLEHEQRVSSTSAWEDQASRQRGMDLLARMRGSVSASETSLMGHSATVERPTPRMGSRREVGRDAHFEGASFSTFAGAEERNQISYPPSPESRDDDEFPSYSTSTQPINISSQQRRPLTPPHSPPSPSSSYYSSATIGSWPSNRTSISHTLSTSLNSSLSPVHFRRHLTSSTSASAVRQTFHSATTRHMSSPPPYQIMDPLIRSRSEETHSHYVSQGDGRLAGTQWTSSGRSLSTESTTETIVNGSVRRWWGL
ncbi:hypothetical protein P7C70_g1809, partial [Phenoliferia sp. Uapishka_3]